MHANQRECLTHGVLHLLPPIFLHPFHHDPVVLQVHHPQPQGGCCSYPILAIYLASLKPDPLSGVPPSYVVLSVSAAVKYLTRVEALEGSRLTFCIFKRGAMGDNGRDGTVVVGGGVPQAGIVFMCQP